MGESRKGGRQMQVSAGSDTFEFRSPHGMKTARSRLRTFAEIGGRCEARTNLYRPAALELQRPNHISFVPAEMRVWGYTDNMESVRELRLSFDRFKTMERTGPFPGLR